jgi:hypothetical protein
VNLSTGVVALTALVVLAGDDARCATLRVPEDHAQIQAAVLAAARGDTVLVGPGEYSELIQMKNGVVLRSAAGPDSTILLNPGLGEGPLDERLLECLDGIDRSTVIEGFTLDANGLSGCGIYCENASPTIRGNVIRGFGWGINLRYSEARVEENTIERCASFGMMVFASSPEIFRNVIRNNAPAGISISGKESLPVIGGSRENANKIYANPRAIQNSSRNDIDATWNDWGWEVTAQMEASPYPTDVTTITDGNDFSRVARGKGKVDYRHWIRPEDSEAPSRRAPPLLLPGIAALLLLGAGALAVIRRRRGLSTGRG